MGHHTAIGMFNFSSDNDWFTWFNRLEGYSYLLKLYCTDVNIKYGNEYSYDR